MLGHPHHPHAGPASGWCSLSDTLAYVHRHAYSLDLDMSSRILQWANRVGTCLKNCVVSLEEMVNE